MDAISTAEQLAELFRANIPTRHIEPDTKAIKYAIYARKSTTSEHRQEKSIEDQLKECMDRVVTPEGLNVVKVITEKYSAKEPDTRAEFKALINDIKAGRITGLISWHPDRLARNMKDAGEIIDLLDKNTLKDLKFATSTFENNPTGKMLLGISFVLSKQYSEHLSESVSRGNRRATEDNGKFIGKLKHGYFINDDRQLFPDGDNFLIVKNIFKMRLEGATQVKIRDWLNTTNYQARRKGKDPASFKWDKDNVSKILRDPVYAGVLVYGDSVVDLTEKYDFTPMITIKEYAKLNKLSSLDSLRVRSAKYVKGGNIRANLLRGLVFCGFCSKSLSSGLTKKKKPDGTLFWYYHYKCETESCEFKNKSIRAGVVIRFVREFFADYMFITRDNYDAYVAEAKTDIKSKTRVLTSSINSLSRQIGEAESDYQKTKDIIKDSPALEQHYDLDELKAVVTNLKQEQSKLISQRDTIKSAIVPYEKYLKLMEASPVILGKMQDMQAMDVIIRKFFSNFTIKQYGKGKQQRWEIDYKLKEPWQGFLENDNFVRGRDDKT